jgi:hypothetical protein
MKFVEEATHTSVQVVPNLNEFHYHEPAQKPHRRAKSPRGKEKVQYGQGDDLS